MTDSTTAMQRYNAAFSGDQYARVGERLASNLNAERDDPTVVDLLVSMQDAAFELCGHPDHVGAWHTLAVQCGHHYLSQHTIDSMREFLRLFNPDDTQIDDFEATAKGILKLYSGMDDLKTATSHANGVHGWRGLYGFSNTTPK